MYSRSSSSQSHSIILSNSIRDEIIDFDNLRENVTGKLNLDNWMVLPSQQTLHIFSLNKKLNGNLSIRNTICVDVDLVVKVFGENNDDTLLILKLYSWPQLKTLIEQCGAQVKREVDFEFVNVVDKTGNSKTSSRDGKDQQEDTLAFQAGGLITKVEVPDFHQPLTELIESSIAEREALGYNATFLSQSSFIHDAEHGDRNAELLVYQPSEEKKSQSQMCSICNESYIIGEMDRHLQEHFNGRSYQCNACDREYQSLIGLQKHVKSNHVTAKGEFLCDVCESGKYFETKAGLEKHMKKSHGSAPQQDGVMKCSTCDKDFYTRKQFTIHLRRHDESKWKPCPICHKRYDNLNRHINGKHFNIKNHVCEICGSAYTQWVGLKEHMQTQHMHDEFFCDICQNKKGYRSKQKLRRHFIKVHIKVGQRRNNVRIKDHICEICGAAYTQWTWLNYHMETKHMNKPSRKTEEPSIYPCETCGKTFAFRGSLTNHAKLHSGKLHVCDECGQSFRHPKYLKRHLKQHKDVVKLRCTMCEKEYVQKVGLRLHMKKIHGVVIGTTQNSDNTEQL